MLRYPTILPTVRLFSRWILVVSLSISIGLPWAFIQGAAWAGMIVSFAREVPLAKSIEMTFGGEHPCPLCKAVQRNDQSQQKNGLARAKIKMNLTAPERHRFVFAAPVSPPRQAFVLEIREPIKDKPPVPPPRTA